MGREILEKQDQKGCIAKIVEYILKYLKKDLPENRGFSNRNLIYMRKFAEVYK